jgi:hypothetical protein
MYNPVLGKTIYSGANLNILEVLQVSKEIDILLRSESYNYQV